MSKCRHYLTGLVVVALMFGCAAAAAAQGNPTGAIRGVVTDPDNLPLPGVLVTASSPALQGVRTAITSVSGDFIIPFLPPGEYIVLFELDSFQSHKQTIGVAMAETIPMKVSLVLARLIETITVTGTASTEVLKTGTIAQTYKSDRIETLPMNRTLESAVLLAPSVNGNGPSGNIVIAGALSYEGLYLINGANVNENLRGQPRTLYVEDAIQETKVSTGNISAEYGRFNGGVVNMITKSGGNEFSGSFRDSLTNDAWRALRPMGDTKTNTIVPAYEFTAGGPIMKDKIWFFGDGKYLNNKQSRVLDYTQLSYPWEQSDKRYEGKITYTANSRNTIKGYYTKRSIWTTNNTSNGPMDLASLYNNGTDDSIMVLNYTGTPKDVLFFEGQFSRKTMQTNETGSQFTDLVKGTLMLDRSRGSARFNSPTFCAVCGNGWHEQRNNWDGFAKVGYFFSTMNSGSHNIIAGFDNFKESRKVDNFQEGSGYRIYVTSTIIDPSAAKTIYPVFDNNSYLEYDPLVAPSVGSDIRTYSAFANDQWRVSNFISVNLGFRYDQNRSKDQGGIPVLRDWQWSPRIGLSWDMRADGKWVANTGFARYVMGVNGAVVDSGSAGGRTASFTWNYLGTPINANCVAGSTCLTADQVLPGVFAWFNTIGGINSTNFRSAPSIPGVTTTVDNGTTAPSSDEITGGIARDLAGHGAIRGDYTYRKYHNMYGAFTDMSTGRVTDSTGRAYDATIVRNTSDADRWYHALTTSADYRLPAIAVGGNYTLSYSKGNNDGENVGSGPVMANINQFPEYRPQSWNWPTGFMSNDQRHKARAYVSWLLPTSPAFGGFTIGAIQRVDSGTPYDMVMAVNPSTYIVNPGYLKPPTSISYYVSDRGALRTDAVFNTDLSFVWSKKIVSTSEVFFRALAFNVFNRQAVMSVDTTVSSNASPGSYTAASLKAFNPFTTVPVQDVNWRLGPQFGQPVAPSSYQNPRSFNFSLGVRF
jgi:Carboxypeptidase regulatory-like domain/TonB-dependent Receptor Plug Domain